MPLWRLHSLDQRERHGFLTPPTQANENKRFPPRRRGDGARRREVDECAKLRAENEHLRNELNAFDLNFFEEIEDLKYRYAESKKRCAELEGVQAQLDAHLRAQQLDR